MEHSRFYEPAYKLAVLTFIENYDQEINFDQVAKYFNIQGGRQTIWRWKKDYETGNIKMTRAPNPEKHSKINLEDTKEQIKEKIKEAHDEHIPITYPMIHESLGIDISLKRIQQLGKNQLDVASKTIIKRCEWECKN